MTPRSRSSRTRVPAVPALADRIHVVRGERVMLDQDLAVLYGVPTKRLNEAVQRNLTRFPKDFMFRLSVDEAPWKRRSSAPFVIRKVRPH